MPLPKPPKLDEYHPITLSYTQFPEVQSELQFLEAARKCESICAQNNLGPQMIRLRQLVAEYKSRIAP